MNATEHTVELYYRYCHRCFTFTDYKVVGGNNRQFDVLAFNKSTGEFRHIEVNVTHDKRWTLGLDSVKDQIRYKFFGIPKNKRPGNLNTDFHKGKTYRPQIESAYNHFGFEWDAVIRVWCLWYYPDDEQALLAWKNELSEEFSLPSSRFEILSFRDQVLPGLLDATGTSNYDDDILRTISLLDQQRKQTNT